MRTLPPTTADSKIPIPPFEVIAPVVVDVAFVVLETCTTSLPP